MVACSLWDRKVIGSRRIAGRKEGSALRPKKSRYKNIDGCFHATRRVLVWSFPLSSQPLSIQRLCLVTVRDDDDDDDVVPTPRMERSNTILQHMPHARGRVSSRLSHGSTARALALKWHGFPRRYPKSGKSLRSLPPHPSYRIALLHTTQLIISRVSTTPL